MSPKRDPDRPDPRPQGTSDEVLAGLESAWEGWIRSIQVMDAATRSLLRAAFAAGYEAGHDAGRRR